jgi:hypothetical protein
VPLNHTYVKSPEASLCFVCSSVRNLVRVMMSVLTASFPITPSPLSFAAMLSVSKCVVEDRGTEESKQKCKRVSQESVCRGRSVEDIPS